MRSLKSHWWFAFVLSLLPLLSRAAAIELVSKSAGGVALGSSTEPYLTSDGRFVVFTSTARSDASDTNGRKDVFLRDRVAGTTRVITGAAGGDQPIINASGRYVVYREFDLLPKLKIVDLESSDPVRTLSYSFGGGRSFQTADNAFVTPDGRFAGLIYRPVPPISTAAGPELCVNDLLGQNRPFNVSGLVQLNDLGRVAMGVISSDQNQNVFLLETSDVRESGDQNGWRDVYLFRQSNSSFVRLSSPAPGQSDDGTAGDPVLSKDSKRAFFIATAPLTSDDRDGHETIYLATSAGGFTNPTPIVTPVRPLTLSRQATSNGDYVVFTGAAGGGLARPYVLEVASGEVKPLAPAGVMLENGAPVISADNRTIAFGTKANLNTADRNRAADVYVVANPFNVGLVGPSNVTMTLPADGLTVSETTSFKVQANAGQGSNPITLLEVEVDGAATANQSFITLAPGKHRLRALAVDAAGVAIYSEPIDVNIIPAANTVKFSDVSGIETILRPDGSRGISGPIAIRSTRSSATNRLRVVLAETPEAATMGGFGDTGVVPLPDENLLQVFEIDPLAANWATMIPVDTSLAAPRNIVDPFSGQQRYNQFQGLGWTVTARLLERNGVNWDERDRITLQDILPDLDQDTPGPNGGIPVLSPNNNANTFNPDQLQSVTIVAPPKVAAGTSRALSAVAAFSTGSVPCKPQWSVAGPGAFITPEGVLRTTSGVTAKLQVKATFFGQSVTKSVQCLPITPKVFVRPAGNIPETGGTEGFTIIRSQVVNAPLSVTFEVSGRALAATDYAQLSQTAVIPAGKSSVFVPINVFDDQVFEGDESITITLNPSSDYLLSGSKSATIFILDNEDAPNLQGDATIQKPGKAPVGKRVIEAPFTFSEQVLKATSVKGKANTFIFQVQNLGNAAANFTVNGPGSVLGFTTKYLVNGADVTAQVTGGTFAFTALDPGATAQMRLIITATEDAPIGSVFPCRLIAKKNTFSDTVEIDLTRNR